MRAGSAFAAALLGLTPALAKADRYLPEPDYFTGVYERVGRDGSSPPKLINETVWISPNPTGGLTVAPCVAGGEAAFPLKFTELFEATNLLSNNDDANLIGCQFFNNMDNYPILTCFQGRQGRFTLWPQPEAKCPAATPP